MADNTLNVRLVLRNDTAAEWTAKNPVLLKGEMGIENDTNKMKIGDGVTAWADLPYAGVDEATITNIIDNNREGVTCIDSTESDGRTDTEIIALQEGSKKGDKLIIERSIGDDKASYTAYVFDGTAWAAMDGNYDASNVYFGKNLTYTVAMGTLAKPASSATFETKGKSVEQVLSSLLAKEANPNKTNPTVRINSQSGSGTYEIGTKKNLTYSASLNPGSYTYGPATGISATSWEVSCTGVEGTKNTSSGTYEGIVAEATAKKITIKASYGDGAIPVTNLGTPYEAGKITAGSASASTGELKGVRYMFWGPVTNDSALTSDIIRALEHKESAAKKTLTTFGAGTGAKKIVVALPAGYSVTSVIMPSALNFDATTLFVKQGATVDVEGAEGYTAAAYNIWVYQPASIDASETYSIKIG